jgi:uncharacterized protein (TIGR03067 family)
MRGRVAVALLVGTCGLLGAVGAEKVPDERMRMQGIWQVVQVTEDGEEASRAELQGARVNVSKDKIFFEVPNSEGFRLGGRFGLSPKEKPAHFDLTDRDDGHVYPGIYRWEQGRLMIALHMELSRPQRPKGFKAEEGSDIQVWVLQRKPR